MSKGVASKTSRLVIQGGNQIRGQLITKISCLGHRAIYLPQLHYKWADTLWMFWSKPEIWSSFKNTTHFLFGAHFDFIVGCDWWSFCDFRSRWIGKQSGFVTENIVVRIISDKIIYWLFAHTKLNPTQQKGSVFFSAHLISDSGMLSWVSQSMIRALDTSLSTRWCNPIPWSTDVGNINTDLCYAVYIGAVGTS